MTPLVSCIMPTGNRQRFLPLAIRFFQEQDYPNKELIILDDAPADVIDPVPAGDGIRYFHERKRSSLGEKRNRANELSSGEIVMHWDDDDWMARDRISRQVNALMTSNADVCGLDRMVFFDTRTRRFWLYQYPPVRRRWVAGGSLCYWKAVWEKRKFRNVTLGEDTFFVWASPELNMCAMTDLRLYLAFIHGGNTCAKVLTGPCWSPWCELTLEQFVGTDSQTYRQLFHWQSN